MDGQFVFIDEISNEFRGKDVSRIVIKTLNRRDSISLAVEKSNADGSLHYRLPVTISRKTIPALIRALSTCKEELDEQRFDACFRA